MPAWTISPGAQPKNYFVVSNLLPPYTKINAPDMTLNVRVLEQTGSMSGDYLPNNLEKIDCSFYASSGTLFGQIRYPPLLNATITKNQITLNFSENQFTDFNSPAEYHENPMLRTSIKVEPAEARVFRISHFCEGFGTEFIKFRQKGAGYLIFFTDRPVKLIGNVDFGTGRKGIVDIAITKAGFHLISISLINETYHFSLAESQAAIAFGLFKKP